MTTLTWLVAAALIGLSTEWTWLFPTAIASALFAGRRRINRILLGAGIVVLGAVQWWLLALRSPYWSQFRQGLTEVGDYVYLEAVARGTAQWAHTDSVLMADTRLGYHWLSFAWSGRITESVGSVAMAFSSHLIQVSFVAISVALMFVITRKLGAGVEWSILASVTLSMLVGVPIGLFQALSVHSPSQPFVIALVLATLLLVASAHELPWWKTVPLAFVLAVGVVGGKVSAIPALLAAAGVLLVQGIRHRRSANAIPLVVLMVSTVLLGFVYFYGGVVSDGTTGSLQISLLEVAFTEGPVAHSNRPTWLAIIGSVAILVGVMALVPGIVLGRSLFATESPILMWLLATSAAVSLVVGFVYVGERSGVSYFFNLAIALLIPLSAASLSRRVSLPAARHLLALAVGGLLGGVLLSNVMVRTASAGTVGSLIRSALLAAPFLLAGAVYFLAKGRSITGPVLLVVGIGLSSYFAWIPRYAIVQARHGTVYVPSTDSISGAPAIREATEWLRTNTARDDVVATNRFCNNHTDRFPDCSAHWNVVSSITGRRMYVENLDWVARSAEGAEERARSSIDFVESPSADTVEILLTANVSWVFVDRSVTSTTNWEPWAEVVFENDDAFILRLLGHGSKP